MSSFTDWLAKLKAAKKGPATLYASRGRKFVCYIGINADYTGSTMRGQVRLSPDAGGAALADFDVSGPTVAGGQTSYVISLEYTVVGGLPAASLGENYIELAYDVLITPDAGDEDLLFGGIFTVLGRITE